MNLRSVRNYFALLVIAAAASLEAPRLARAPLATAAVELADVPAGVSSALSGAARRAAPADDDGSHLGFDTNVYPGDRAMRAWKLFGKYEWVGYYLPAPCHKDDSWSGTRARLVNQGWGLAVIYVGQQTWGKSLGAPSRARHTTSRSRKSIRSRSRHTMRRESKAPVAKPGSTCSAAFVNAAHGRKDALDAVARTKREGFPAGTVVFLDVEHMTSVPQPMRDYYREWTGTVLADGTYRPGIYAHTKNANTIYDDVNDVYDAFGIDADPPFWIAGTGDFSIDGQPTDVGHEFASVWQGMLDVVRTHNGVRLPIDISVASAASPSLAQ